MQNLFCVTNQNLQMLHQLRYFSEFVKCEIYFYTVKA